MHTSYQPAGLAGFVGFWVGWYVYPCWVAGDPVWQVKLCIFDVGFFMKCGTHTLTYRNCIVCVVLEHCRYLMTFMNQLNDVADRLVRLLSSVADGQTALSMHMYFCQATMDVIAEVWTVLGFFYPPHLITVSTLPCKIQKL